MKSLCVSSWFDPQAGCLRSISGTPKPSHAVHKQITELTINHRVEQAVVTLFLYLFAVVLPVLKSYRGYLLPLNLILTYLWLTSLIFSSQDYSGGRCVRRGRSTRCGTMHTVQAFFIVGLYVPIPNGPFFLAFPRS